MATISLAIPKPIVEYIDWRVSAQGYDGRSDYIRDLVRRDQREQAAHRVSRPDAEHKFWEETVGDGSLSPEVEVEAEAARLTPAPNVPEGLPMPRETFMAVAARLGLTDSDLASRELRLRVAHLAMYALAGFLLVYALWVTLTESHAVGACILTASIATAVQGYLVGLRAWQIQHKMLVPLREALRMPDTYLVI